jgi:CRISPR-associated protein GSU0053 (Cas_GSU0053).
MDLSLPEKIYNSVTTDAAIRTRLKLQPAGGVGTKVFPPTYQGPRDSAVYATEKRKLENDELKKCVLLDSVQSQANRMEEALLEANRPGSGDLDIPLIQVDFTDNFEDIGKISTLDAPHRIADAVFRESTYRDDAFRQTEYGQMFENSSMEHASSLYRICPTALLFGVWDSTGQGGAQQGAKFPRCITSEIIGVGIEEGVDPAGRISPVDITGTDATLYETESGQLTYDEAEAKDDAEAMKPSEANLGNIPPSYHDEQGGRDDTLPGGVTMEYGELSTVISLSALRRLSFPENGTADPERTQYAQASLAALGLVAISKQYDFGYSLRSRCTLVPQEELSFEIVERTGDTRSFTADSDRLLDAFKTVT